MRQTRMARLPAAIVCGGVLLCGSSSVHGQAGGARTFDRRVHLEDAAATSANDMDGDGDLDVVVSNDTPDPKIVHLNDGRGRFTRGSTFGKGEWSTRYISVIDLNGDARPDVVLANRYGRTQGPSYVCFGVEGGRFAEECVGVAQGSATTIEAADFNRDGFPDLAVPHRDGGQGFIYLNDGKGTFGGRRPFGPSTAAIRTAAPADLDGDGVLDLVVIDESTGPAIFRGRADGTFSAAEALGADGAVPFGDSEGTAYGFAVGDLDEDGFLDIAMARSDARNMLYFGGPAGAEPQRPQ